MDTRAVRRVERRPDAVVDPEAWPATVPAVAHLLAHGLDLPAGVTFLVGENGAGKSTVVEAVAELLGIPPEGGSTAHRAGADRGRGSDRSGLAGLLRVVRGAGGRHGRQGFFLRAETAHRFVTYLEDAGARGDGPPAPHPLHRLSHGEQFTEVLATQRWTGAARVVLLDEPESAMSFQNHLALAGTLAAMARRGTQVLCATHSPLLTAVPGALVLQLDDDGIHRAEWEDLDVVHHWRFFLDAPERYLRHVLPPAQGAPDEGR
ncbi:AAA family ATPase [Kineococcus sp. SYSU DK004]|uniref:AAA family ATPase n=1 Tax=Kineococcus sp. SYSU DK004 TaxID=3383125 RepID=UPI003D7EFEF3